MKSHIENLLRSKGLYKLTLGIDTTPTDAKKKDKWDKKNYSIHGLIVMSIYPYLRFHLEGIDSPTAWKKMDTIFGVKNKIQDHHIENELLTLDPNKVSLLNIFLI